MNHSPSTAREAEQNSGHGTRVAVLGTLAAFHDTPIPYDLRELVRLVSEIQPDLLCLDMTERQWREQDLEDLPPEYREALLPLAYGTDIVVVPIAEDSPPSEPSAAGLRGQLIGMLRGWLVRIEQSAPSPDAVNYGWRHGLSNLLYSAILRLGGLESREAWQDHTHHLIKAALSTVRRDPGRRILIVVNVRHCHHIRPALSSEPGVDVVDHHQL